MRNLTVQDLPILRRLRDAYRQMIEAANAAKQEENDVGMLMAYASVLDELQGKFDGVGKQLSRLERSAT